MDRKTTSPRRAPRKKKKTKFADIRMTLILLAIIFGVSATLFFGKALLQKSGSTPIATAPDTVSTPVPTSVPETPVPLAVPQIEVPPASALKVEPAAPNIEPPVTQEPVKQDPVNTKPAAAVVAALTTVAPVDGNISAGKKNIQPSPFKTPDSKKPPIVKTSVSIITRPPPDKTLVPKHKGTLIFVFDDAGNNLKQLEPFLKLPFPCTIAVMPGLRYSKETADRIRAAGKDVILHQPMQALNLSVNPGPGAIVKGMSTDQIKTLLRKNLAEVGPVVGMNNHEGSLITADRASMEAVLDVVREQRIFFLDSRTNADTVAPILAREKNMTIWERAVFLDNSQDHASIIEAVQNGMKIAENKGAAVMIGHIWSNDLADILIGMYPELVSQGFSLSTIAEIATNGEFDE